MFLAGIRFYFCTCLEASSTGLSLYSYPCCYVTVSVLGLQLKARCIFHVQVVLNQSTVAVMLHKYLARVWLVFMSKEVETRR